MRPASISRPRYRESSTKVLTASASRPGCTAPKEIINAPSTCGGGAGTFSAGTSSISSMHHPRISRLTVTAVRALVQRVTRARVTVSGETVGAIGAGLCAFIGVTHDDDADKARRLADKLWHLRILEDADGVM